MKELANWLHLIMIDSLAFALKEQLFPGLNVTKRLDCVRDIQCPIES